MKSFLAVFFLGVFCISACHPKQKTRDDCIGLVVDDFSKKISKKYGLQVSGVGGGGVEKIGLMSIRSNLYKKKRLEEARDILVGAVTLLLEMINSSKEIRPFLIEYPISFESVEFGISFLSQGEGDNLDYIFLRKGMVYFSRYVDGTDRLEDFLKEDYEVAHAEWLNREKRP